MNVSIIDPEHFEVAYTLIRLFMQQGHDLHVYTNNETQQQLQYLLSSHPSPQWTVRGPGVPERAFIKEIFTGLAVQKPDLIFLSTVPNNHVLYAWYLKKFPGIPVVLTLHNINAYLHWPKTISLRSVVRAAGKRMLLQRADTLHVLTEGMAATLRSSLKGNIETLVIPGSFYETVTPAPGWLRGIPINIVIPGSVDPRRRDYDAVFRLLDIAKDTGFNLEVTFAGAFPKGQDSAIAAQCRSYRAAGHQLIFFDDNLLPQELFDGLLADAHFIWMPSRHHTILQDGIPETYGETMSSGNVGDVIRFSRPLLAPAFLHLDPAVEQGTVRYNNAEDLAALLAAMDENQYRQLLEGCYERAQFYTLAAIIDRNLSFFSNLQQGTVDAAPANKSS